MAGLTGPAGSAVVFDLGGVLIDWNPRHLYRSLFDDPAAMEDFLASVCSPEWNRQHDLGRPFADTVPELSAQFPQHASLIAAYRDRWSEMVLGEVPGTVAVLADLRHAGAQLYALTNWSAETFPSMRRRFSFLGWFTGIVVSGEVGVGKPDERAFQVLCERYGLAAGRVVLVDDSAENVAAAQAFGMRGVLFTSADALRAELAALGVLPAGLSARQRPVSLGRD